MEHSVRAWRPSRARPRRWLTRSRALSFADRRNVRYLHLQFNYLESLPRDVGKLDMLRDLDLSNNGVGGGGVKACIKLLGECGSLAALSLAGTKLEFTDTDALQGAANVNADIGRTKAVRLWMGKDSKNWPPL